MSKKTRKKSPRASSGKATAAQRITSAKTSPSKKTRKATANKLPSGAVRKNAAASPRAELVEGARAPAFRLPRDGGSSVSLSDFAGKKMVVFFYPRADTPGCTKEAIDFTRLASAFAQNQTAIVGVSADPPKAQEAFRDKHRLTTPLISDEKHEMLEAYGAWGEKSMYGKVFQGVLRTTVLIDEDGRIARIWRRVKVDGHADEVLAATRAL